MKQEIYKHMILGTAYYPEHWSPGLWEPDLLRMKEQGINMVRIADFAWGKLEPEEGRFQINYFDEFLELCTTHQMEVIFCTPTAAPPMWLIHQYPEVLNCDMDGNRYYGPRRHYNYNSNIYRNKCEILVRQLVQHYSKWEIIKGWQIDNELNCDLSEFYSSSDHLAYREYLRKKFDSLEQLNEAMGLTFWSREYSDWDQVTLNRKCVGGAVNPHLALEERRFFSESAISFCRLQADILRECLPQGVFLTTNGLFANLDYNKLMACGLDFITFDSYPNFAFDLAKDPKQAGNLNDRKWSWNLMWTRSVSPVFGIMEQQAGANGWSSRMETPMPKPGQMRLWTMQSIAHGADLVAYFRWRTSPIGCEIYWHGLNDYSNIPNRRLVELKQISQEMNQLESLRGTVYASDVAVVKDYDNEWDASIDCWHGRIAGYSDNSWFMAVQQLHTPCDFLYLNETSTLEQLSHYKVLIYPHPAIMKAETSRLLQGYVENGGTLIFGARSGYKDEYGRCPMRAMPGLVSEWCGIHVTEYTLTTPGETERTIRWQEELISAPLFHEVLDPVDDNTEILAVHQEGYYDGKPAACRRAVGEGIVYYIGSCFSLELARHLLQVTNTAEPYQKLMRIPESVELAVRSDGEKKYMFLLNYHSEKVAIELHQELPELLSGDSHTGTLVLEPFDVRVFVSKE